MNINPNFLTEENIARPYLHSTIRHESAVPRQCCVDGDAVKCPYVSAEEEGLTWIRGVGGTIFSQSEVNS